MANVKKTILVACHKPTECPKDTDYMPIHVGHAGARCELGFQVDDDGENISDKNYCYCELTALYWAWKNLKDVDVVGLCHYRRYFDFHKQCLRFMPDTTFPISAMGELDFSIDEQSLQTVLDGGVVVPQVLPFNGTLRQQYCEAHMSEDYRVLQDVFIKTQNKKYQNAFEEIVVKGYKVHPYNMFIMRWDDFDSYCTWLFEILQNVENQSDISRYSQFQKRIYGFMAERLMNVWLQAEGKYLLEKPVIFLDEAGVGTPSSKFALRLSWKYYKRFFYCGITNWAYKKTL